MLDILLKKSIINLWDRVRTRQVWFPAKFPTPPQGAEGRQAMIRIKYPTQQEIKNVLDYNPKSGVFTWKTQLARDNRWNTKYAGKNAGNTKSRYIQIEINGIPYMAHRLAWIYVYGDEPFGDLDHKNRDKKSNWIDNLRLSNASINQINTDKKSYNKTGVVGVSWDKSRVAWMVHIGGAGNIKTVGRFKNFAEAVKARYDAEVERGYPQYNPESTAYQYLQENH